VFPCIYFLGKNQAVGNIRETPIRELWFSGKYNRLRKSLANCEKCDAMCHLEPAFLFNRFWFPKRR
jgi:radical SAM protein with 4Fe4S-binding SPASM domain